jgi:5,5'-dehydrodivanillate O-demethylase oxygenase subunit
MLTPAENERLTQVGAGTPAGALLRRYWHPIAAVDEMAERWTKRVRLLGEDLVLFKNRGGRFGLIAEACPHRRASFAYGIPTAAGIRCPYHGWMFDGTGRCVEQPNEPEGSSFKEKVTTAGYPVGVLGGLLFAYLGPAPAPQIPRLEGFVADRAIRLLGSAVVPCNWLQIMENSVDPIHSEWLHGHFAEFVAEASGGATYSYSRKHMKIAFDEVDYGIVKRRLMVGQDEGCDDWQIGHPVVFPNVLALGSVGNSARTFQYQIRVPMDDTHTLHLWYTAFIPPEGVAPEPVLMNAVHRFDVPLHDANGEYLLDITDAQDLMVWSVQGEIADRTGEHLGSTDRGLTAFRRMLLREIRRVEEGADPLGVVRGSGERVLTLPLERQKGHHAEGFASVFLRRHWRYAPVADALIALFAERASDPR